MKSSTIHIQNMCCQRCVDVVTDELKKLNLKILSVKLGQAHYENLKGISLNAIESVLNKRGFLLAKNEEEMLVENIKISIIDLINQSSEMDRKNISLPVFLEEKTQISYRSLLEIFKKHKKITIEKYFILQKIERVKDLIENSNMHFSEIADVMGYKSPQHLSSQFKSVTRITMQKFKKSREKQRSFIDRL